MAEELAFNQVFGNGGAIYFYKHFVFAQALRVDGAGDQLFSRARLAVNEHAAVGGSHQLDLLPQRLYRNAVADDDAVGSELPLEFAVLSAQAVGVNARA